MLSTADLEQRAERAVRRGDLLAAIELFEGLLAQDPEHARARHRLDAVRALLQPSELVARRRPGPEELADEPAADLLNDAEQGELHASAGRFREAQACYERACARSPGNELLRERLDELRALAPPGVRADLGKAERLERAEGFELTPGGGSSVPGRSARASQAAFGPLLDGAPAGAAGGAAAGSPRGGRGHAQGQTPTGGSHGSLASQREAFLQELLARVRQARQAARRP